MSNLSRKTGPKGLALIKEFEGLELKAYRCPAGILTIGYGHTTAAGAPVVRQGLTITAQEAEDILRSDLVQYERAVNEAVTVPLTQEQFDALVSFTFNLGAASLRKSTLLKKLNAGDHAAVPAQLKKWIRAGGKKLEGLVRRRNAEALLWTGSMPAVTQAPPDVEPVEPKKEGWLVRYIKGILK
jgi:lysozyme